MRFEAGRFTASRRYSAGQSIARVGHWGLRPRASLVCVVSTNASASLRRSRQSRCLALSKRALLLCSALLYAQSG